MDQGMKAKAKQMELDKALELYGFQKEIFILESGKMTPSMDMVFMYLLMESDMRDN